MFKGKKKLIPKKILNGYDKKYREKNRGLLNEKQREYYQKNRDKFLDRNKKYNKNNIGTIRIWERSYHKTPEGYYRHLKKKAKERKKDFNITKDEFKKWFLGQKKKCCYCDCVLIYDNKVGTSPSVDRMDNSKGYSLDNICLCCVRCNKAKNIFFTYEEMLVVGKAIKKVLLNRKKYVDNQGDSMDDGAQSSKP